MLLQGTLHPSTAVHGDDYQCYSLGASENMLLQGTLHPSTRLILLNEEQHQGLAHVCRRRPWGPTEEDHQRHHTPVFDLE